MSPGSVITGGLAAFAALSAYCVSRHANMLAPTPPVAAVAPAVTTPPPVPAPVADTAATRVATTINDRLAGRSIEFETNSAVITRRGRAVLDSLVPILTSAPIARFEVAGHTDFRGSDVANQALSDARAASVVRYLGRRGIAATRLEPRGYGESRPISTDSTETALQRNRRIEFTPIPER